MNKECKKPANKRNSRKVTKSTECCPDEIMNPDTNLCILKTSDLLSTKTKKQLERAERLFNLPHDLSRKIFLMNSAKKAIAKNIKKLVKPFTIRYVASFLRDAERKGSVSKYLLETNSSYNYTKYIVNLLTRLINSFPGELPPIYDIHDLRMVVITLLQSNVSKKDIQDFVYLVLITYTYIFSSFSCSVFLNSIHNQDVTDNQKETGYTICKITMMTEGNHTFKGMKLFFNGSGNENSPFVIKNKYKTLLNKLITILQTIYTTHNEIEMFIAPIEFIRDY